MTKEQGRMKEVFDDKDVGLFGGFKDILE